MTWILRDISKHKIIPPSYKKWKSIKLMLSHNTCSLIQMKPKLMRLKHIIWLLIPLICSNIIIIIHLIEEATLELMTKIYSHLKKFLSSFNDTRDTTKLPAILLSLIAHEYHTYANTIYKYIWYFGWVQIRGDTPVHIQQWQFLFPNLIQCYSYTHQTPTHLRDYSKQLN